MVSLESLWREFVTTSEPMETAASRGRSADQTEHDLNFRERALNTRRLGVYAFLWSSRIRKFRSIEVPIWT